MTWTLTTVTMVCILLCLSTQIWTTENSYHTAAITTRPSSRPVGIFPPKRTRTRLSGESWECWGGEFLPVYQAGLRASVWGESGEDEQSGDRTTTHHSRHDRAPAFSPHPWPPIHRLQWRDKPLGRRPGGGQHQLPLQEVRGGLDTDTATHSRDSIKLYSTLYYTVLYIQNMTTLNLNHSININKHKVILSLFF